ncbi:MAG: DUF6893 family small protein [Acidimicrobiales bacterium]
MRIVGILATVVVILLVLGALVMFVRSLPDLARYRRLRKM